MKIKLKMLNTIMLSIFLSMTIRNRARLRSLFMNPTKDLILFVVSPEDFNTPSEIGRYPDKVFSLHKIVLEMGLKSEIIFHPWVSTKRNLNFIRVLRVESFVSSLKKYWTIQRSQHKSSRENKFYTWWSSLSLLEKYQFSIWSDFLDKTKPLAILGIDLKEYLVVASKLENIPVVEVMHGVFTNESIPLKRYSRGSYQIVPVDLFLSWDSHYSNLIEAVNIPTITLGHPNEHYSSYLPFEFNFHDGNILVTLSWGVENSFDPFGMLHMNLADKLLLLGGELSKLVFRLHPVAYEQNRNRMKYVTNWFQKNFPGSNLSTPKETSLFDELSNARLHITDGSSSFYEAGLLGVPTIFTSLRAYNDTPQEYKSKGQIYLWKDAEDVNLFTLTSGKRVTQGCNLDREKFKEVINNFQIAISS